MQQPRGRVEVIAGPMFAGKTEELIRRVRRAAIAGKRVQVWTHALDTRNRAGLVSSHAGATFPSFIAENACQIEEGADSAALIAVDEAQFFGPDLVASADRLAQQGVDVVIAGLVVTFEGDPFEPIPSLMALAERVDKLTAVCSACGADAIYHQRMSSPIASSTALAPEHVGGADKYEARCRIHFDPPEPPHPL